MSDQGGELKTLFVAGIGLLTPVGNTALTAAAVKAGISAYSASRFRDKRRQQITMAEVPTELLASLDAEIDSGTYTSAQHDRVIAMAIIALQEACTHYPGRRALPLILTMPEAASQDNFVSSATVIDNLVNNCNPLVDPQLSRSLHSGRAAGIEALDFAYRYLIDSDHDYLLIGGSDSHKSYSRLDPLDAADRLLAPGAQDSFAASEGAAFLLLTPHESKAMVREGRVIAIHRPGLGREPGHIYGDQPYLGEGLDQAFKQALARSPGNALIRKVYSSMNGEHYWAKEYGVAYMRNREAFAEELTLEHPADVFGDLWAATAVALIGLAAEALWAQPDDNSYLAYGSSDYGLRGAVRLEKIVVDS